MDTSYRIRLECALEALRKRNGELAEALAKADPDHPFTGKPLGDTRSTTLIRLVDTAIELANDAATIEELREAASAYQEYWERELADKAAKKKARKDAQEAASRE